MPEPNLQPASVVKPKRRWLSYSLRTMLLLVTLLCVWLGVQVNRANKQRRAVEAIEKLGGAVMYDCEERRYRPGGSGSKPPGPAWLRTLIGRDYFDTVVQVDLVDLYDEDAIDIVLQHAAKLPDIQYVGSWSRSPRISDNELVRLKGLTHLEQLAFSFDDVSDTGLAQLRGLVQLRGLWLSRNGMITDSGLKQLAELTKLEVLTLSRTKITDAGLEHLKGLSQLTALDLGDTQITDAGLEHIKNFGALRFIILKNTKVTDGGLAHLKGLRELRGLWVSGTNVTEEGMQDLKNALPNLRIYVASSE